MNVNWILVIIEVCRMLTWHNQLNTVISWINPVQFLKESKEVFIEPCGSSQVNGWMPVGIDLSLAQTLRIPSSLIALLKHARKNRNNLYVCLLDVSKAFDSVPHKSTERALRRNNAPNMLIDIINDQYSNVYTSISYHEKSSTKIKLLRGVKQGDPLSSLLFNLVVDELFDWSRMTADMNLEWTSRRTQNVLPMTSS